MKIWIITSFLVLGSVTAWAAPPDCAPDAVMRAKSLLAFHTGDDDRAAVEPTAKVLPPLRNPGNEDQELTVLEVMGDVYKGKYRMRFYYYPLADECVLMGQEIMELADL